MRYRDRSTILFADAHDDTVQHRERYAEYDGRCRIVPQDFVDKVAYRS